jgi:hypothetical protein
VNTYKGPSINDFSSKGVGGGIKNVGIYIVKRRQKGREGVIKWKKWADVVYGNGNRLFSKHFL